MCGGEKSREKKKNKKKRETSGWKKQRKNTIYKCYYNIFTIKYK